MERTWWCKIDFMKEAIKRLMVKYCTSEFVWEATLAKDYQNIRISSFECT